MVAYRKGIGGMSVHKNGGINFFGRNISCKPVPEGGTFAVLDKNEAAGFIGFHDITADDIF